MGEKDSLSSNYKPDGDGVPIVVVWRTAVYNSRRLSKRAKYVAFLLSMRMDGDGYTFVGADELAHRGGYQSRKPVGLGLAELRKRGYLKSKRVYRKGHLGYRYDHWAKLPGRRDELPEREQDEWFAAGADVFGG